MMQRLISRTLAICLYSLFMFNLSNAQVDPRPPYPIIFIHGLVGSDESFHQTYLKLQNDLHWGDVYVYDVVLNADNNVNSALLEADVKYEDFYFDGKFINVGRRNYAEDIDDFTDEWTNPDNRIFTINFAEERIRGASGLLNDLFDGSNQSAIVKQAFALKKVIQDVLAFTGKEKVVLVGHSMGGLAIREYLQRTEDGTNGSLHRWWVDPSTSDGHKVARVVTIGTPHAGSNFLNWPGKKSHFPDPSSEAVRDLRYHYEIIHDIPGAYLFGGSESEVAQHESYNNADFNCDGDELDPIIGINNSGLVTTDNPSIPLPDNIRYTWITSDVVVSPGDGGDLVVDLPRQWLHNNNDPVPLEITDTLLTNRTHLGEGDAWDVIIRGLDEPTLLYNSYLISMNTWISGVVSRSMNMVLHDTDTYKINYSEMGMASIDIVDAFNNLTKVVVRNSFSQIIYEKVLLDLNETIEFPISSIGNYYISIIGQADENQASLLHPYSFRCRFSSVSLMASFSASQHTGVAPCIIHFTDHTNGFPDTWTWDFDNDGVIDSYLQHPSYTYSTPGIYTVRLTVSNSNSSNTVVYNNFISIISTSSQNKISGLEYFFDNDPGIGNGTSIIISPSDSLFINTTLTISHLTPGFHTLFIRSYDSNGNWSYKTNSQFFISTVQQSPNYTFLKKLEYYFDQDPGYGMANSVSVTPSNQVELPLSVSLDNISNGFHVLWLRALDSKNRWSYNAPTYFYKRAFESPMTGASLSMVEYFIDSDPGLGNAGAVQLSTDSLTQTLSLIADVSNISDGFHNLKIRAKDSEHRWSYINSNYFYKHTVPLPTGTQTLASAEYFIDNDPGIGSGEPLVFSTDSTSQQLSLIVDVSNISDGFHNLKIRAKDTATHWSFLTNSYFYKHTIIDTIQNSTLAAAEYFIDNDPGIGLASTISFSADSGSQQKSVVIDLSNTSDGFHIFKLRARDIHNHWSMVNQINFFKRTDSVETVSLVKNIKILLSGNRQFTTLVCDTLIIDNFDPDTVVNVSTKVTCTELNPGMICYIRAFATTSTGKIGMHVTDSIAVTPPVLVNLRVLFQGLFNNGTMVSDTATVKLRSTVPPYTVLDSNAILIDDAGFGQAQFPKIISGRYLLTINQRNSIETWSNVSGILLSSNLTNEYNFTLDSSKAYGNNLIKKDGLWCIYSGDVNQDGFVDFSDLALIDNDAYNFVYGYKCTDLNGDNFVDFSDLALCDNNAYNFIGIQKPGEKNRIIPQGIKQDLIHSR